MDRRELWEAYAKTCRARKVPDEHWENYTQPCKIKDMNRDQWNEYQRYRWYMREKNSSTKNQ